jgi:hypothetical protein
MTQIYLIDSPTPFDTLETWQRHLADVRRLPDGTLLKSELVRTAEQMAARLRADLDGRLAGVTWRVTKLVLGDLVRATHPPAPDRPGAVHPRPRPLPKSKS